jgi:transaldolase
MDTNDGNVSGLKYVNALIGRDSITAMSLNTLGAYLDHGVVAPTLERNLQEVLALFGELEALGIDLDRVGVQLERERIGAIASSLSTALTRLASAT